MTIKTRFLKWLIMWGYFGQGIVGILTLGFYNPVWAVSLASIYSKARYDEMRLQSRRYNYEKTS